VRPLWESLAPARWRELRELVGNFIGKRFAKANPADVDELTQETLLRIVDPDYRDWDPERESLEAVALSVASGVVRNHVQRKRFTHEILRPQVQPAGAIDLAAQLEAASALAAAGEHACAEAMTAAVWDVVRTGVTRPTDIASALGWPRKEVVNAKRRLAHAFEKRSKKVDLAIVKTGSPSPLSK
jgi:DNA-directed RNA polymerase specialized sigma24 family protein